MNNDQRQIDPATLRQLASMVPIVGDTTAENLKALFSQQQGHTPATEPPRLVVPEEATVATDNRVAFVPFEDGNLIKYDELANKPGVFALLVRETSDGKSSTLVHVGSARGRAIAEMLCDGVNFLFACKDAEQRLALDAKAEELKGQIIEIPRAPAAKPFCEELEEKTNELPRITDMPPNP